LQRCEPFLFCEIVTKLCLRFSVLSNWKRLLSS